MTKQKLYYYHIRKNGQDIISFLSPPPTQTEILAYVFPSEVRKIAKEKLPEIFKKYMNCKITPFALADEVAKVLSEEKFKELIKINNLTITEETKP